MDWYNIERPEPYCISMEWSHCGHRRHEYWLTERGRITTKAIYRIVKGTKLTSACLKANSNDYKLKNSNWSYNIELTICLSRVSVKTYWTWCIMKQTDYRLTRGCQGDLPLERYSFTSESSFVNMVNALPITLLNPSDFSCLVVSLCYAISNHIIAWGISVMTFVIHIYFVNKSNKTCISVWF